jgi:hypothetical protein
MPRPLFAVLAICLITISAGQLRAETLDVPETKQETFSITLPGRGMTMQQVEERFGAPLEKHGPVGTPPITTWVYDRFSVYFEDRYVIHAVFDKPK